jgi:Amt family ammonium transporter
MKRFSLSPPTLLLHRLFSTPGLGRWRATRAGAQQGRHRLADHRDPAGGDDGHPGLGLFYGGMVRAKNMLSVLMQTLVIFCLLGVLWAVYGYSLAFTDGNAFIGGFDKLFMKGVTPETVVATFSKGVVLPEYLFASFELTFAAITPALIIGGFAERIKFSAVLIFMVLWFTFSYIPMAHMVWYWAGPDAFTSAEAAAKAGEFAGFLFNKGALDFAGGTVVHINAGVAALVGAYMQWGRASATVVNPWPPTA